MNDNDDEEVPFYLMPVAAILGVYSFMAIVRVCYLVYANIKGTTSVKWNSQPFWTLLATLVTSILGYAYIVAKIETSYQAAEYALFDPYEILDLTPSTTNTTLIKQAYRAKALKAHPDKGGDAAVFQNIQLAYKALTDETAKHNYQVHGHPNGPLVRPILELALPSWLLFPQGNIALVMILLYFSMIAGLIYVVVQQFKNASHDESSSLLDHTNSVSIQDMLYLTRILQPNSSHMDVLYAVISTPESIQQSNRAIEKVQQLIRERQEQENQKPKNKNDAFEFDLNQGGWDEDDDDNEDEATKQARRKAEEERQADMARLKQATGQAVQLLEGVDDGVLGQKWVERTLQSKGAWPPKLKNTILQDAKFEYHGRSVSALDHPGLRRNLCMTMGRLNSLLLNSHPELLEAGSQKLIDQTYFKGSMEFRGRVGALLEAALRIAITLRSHKLIVTVIEAVSMFKIGTAKIHDVDWFNKMMERQYETVPRMIVTSKDIQTADEEEIATGDLSELSMELERPFADAFLRKKVELCKKQGIPPEVALQTYREGWWFLLRAERLDGKAQVDPLSRENPVVSKMDESDIAKFENEPAENRLLTAWPMIVQNISQKSGKVKIQFKAPKTPGKYRFYVSIKSQDFLGADQTFTLDSEIVDVDKLQRSSKKEDDDKDEGEESKKEK